MTSATDIQIFDAAHIQVDSASIDVSWVESAEDKAYLLEKGVAIKTVVARAALTLGKILTEVQDRFTGRKVGLQAYYKSLGFTYSQAVKWVNAYASICDYKALFPNEDPAKALAGISDTALDKLQYLPTEMKEEFLMDAQDGEILKSNKIKEVLADPRVQKSKAEEMLERAEARKAQKAAAFEEVKADPDISSTDKEYREASSQYQAAKAQVSAYEKQIAELQAQIEEERLKTAKENERNAKLEVELQKMRFDDASIRADRIKRVSNSLLVQVPAVLSEVQKFYAEIEHYDNNTRDFLEEQFDLLTQYISNHR